MTPADWTGLAALVTALATAGALLWSKYTESDLQKRKAKLVETKTESEEARRDRVAFDKRVQDRIFELEKMVTVLHTEHIESVKSDSASKARLEVMGDVVNVVGRLESQLSDFMSHVKPVALN